jgi:hypothetical protein
MYSSGKSLSMPLLCSRFDSFVGNLADIFFDFIPEKSVLVKNKPYYNTFEKLL